MSTWLKIEAVDSSYAVRYRDEHGKVMTEADFSVSVSHGRSFQLTRDTSAHTATLTLEAKGAKPALSPAEIAAIKAAPLGQNFLKPGQPVPAFRLTSTDGRRFDNAALRGRVTLVNFFFAMCGPCIAETPTLTAYAKKHPQQQVLAVTFDDAKTAKAYVTGHGFSWPVLVDGMGFDQAMGVNVYPVMALVGADGHLLKMNISGKIASRGGIPTVGDLERWVDAGSAKAQHQP